MDIAITPSVLEFKAPLTKPSTEYITITNSSADTIAFKVKTTAPKLYCVRPNAATVQAGESVEVSIILLGLKEEPEANAKCNDKFLIVTMPCPYDLGESSVGELWPKLEAEFKSESVSKKIKVRFVADAVEEEPSALASGAAAKPASSNLDNVKSSEVLEKDTEQVSEEDRSKIDALNNKLDSSVAASAVSEKKSAPGAKQQAAQSSPMPITTIMVFAIIALIIAWLFL